VSDEGSSLPQGFLDLPSLFGPNEKVDDRRHGYDRCGDGGRRDEGLPQPKAHDSRSV
jgi:hypothetical protein